VGLLPRQSSRRAGAHTVIRCAVPRTCHRADAATPTRRTTIQALERARGAGDPVGASSNYPAWRLGGEPAPPPGRAEPAGAAARRPGPDGTAARGLRALTACGRILLGWLAACRGRLGDRLFAMNDAEAYWRGWQITKTRGSFGRRYRDPQFGLLAGCPRCRGAGGTASRPCPPCLGTGRITRAG
jgi:hypothetical protein